MNVFNRIVVTVGLFVLIALALIAIIVPYPAIQIIKQGLLRAEAGLNYQTWQFVLIAGVGVIVISLILLWLELRRPRATAVTIQKVSGGRAKLRTESIARRIVWHVDRLTDVVKATPHVRAKGNGVEIDLDLETSPEIDVPMKTEEVIAVVRDQVEEKMGLKLLRVNVQIRSTEYPEGLPLVKEAPQWKPSTPPASNEEQIVP